MFFLYLGLTVGTLGTLILGIAVVRVHSYILQEHKIDGVVLRAIKRERYITAFGIGLIVIGYVLEMVFYSTAAALIAA